jgi:Flp pilus assembly pilin Flp
MARLVMNLIANEDGATMVEYVLLIVLIAAAMVVSLGTLKTALNGKFTSVTTTLTAAS